MQLGLNKQLQPHEIKSYKHKIKNQTSKNRKQRLLSHSLGIFLVLLLYCI